ncbi:hypothetical protein MVEN_00263500 [Mycena venus]|uniref:DUF6535 domain-containing protein n=1 Tax=Mycena venus TaxID=2733690 RepID=A0A8H6Z2M6_9AGAR|nr:hypothetical protein MVEN_00263500 [Mycena venus]
MTSHYPTSECFMSPSPTEAPTAGNAPNPSEPIPLQATFPENEKSGEVTHGSPGENVNGALGALIEQSASLKTIVESLTKAVEALKQQPQSPDKRIAFWTAYKKLADEFDDELQRKYGQDLDTSLIFAGLFSAVSSAFIIQIQPELQPDPNTATQALLAVLVQNITSSSAAQLSLEASMSQATVPSTTVVIAQSLLYFSLFSTLLAALLAVLAKQWLLHYNSVGERGTITERGIERQRKFDGMCRWRFDLVMQVFPPPPAILPPLVCCCTLHLSADNTPGSRCNYTQSDSTRSPFIYRDGHFRCSVTGFTIPDVTQFPLEEHFASPPHSWMLAAIH